MHGVGVGTYHEEEALGKAYDARLMRRLWTYMRPYRNRLLISLVLLLAVYGFQILLAFLMQIAIDSYIQNPQLSVSEKISGLNIVGAIILLLLGSGFVLRYYEEVIRSITGQHVIFDLRTEVFNHILKLPARYFDRTPIGRLITRVTTDIEALDQMFAYGVVTILGDLVKIFVIVIILFAVDFKLSLVTFTVVPFLIGSTMYFRLKARDAFRSIRVLLAKLNSLLHENITGMSVVQMFARERKNRERFEGVNADLRNAQINAVFYESALSALVEFIGSVGLALILWYGGGQIVRETLTFGYLVLFIELVQRFFEPIFGLSQQYTIMQSAMASSERIFSLLDTREMIENPAEPVPFDNVGGEIEFHGVEFRYKKDDPVIKGVSFKIAPGEKVAIVGATGSGKTTLIKLLTRLYDVDKGGIFVDGRDIRSIDKHELRENIGMVLQDVFLFSGDIDYNIRIGNDSITPEMVKEAARKANVDAFIDRFPNQYNEEIQERGRNLSSGEKQLISFARVLAYEPKILVLDEATSSVDTRTERLIQQAVHKLMEGRTSIVIAHRLSTIKDVNRILVMHKGQIVEEGTHLELLEKRGIYYRLYLLQYKGQEALNNISVDAGENR
jgi:ATP-binding cassette subfamily B protein